MKDLEAFIGDWLWVVTFGLLPIAMFLYSFVLTRGFKTRRVTPALQSMWRFKTGLSSSDEKRILKTLEAIDQGVQKNQMDLLAEQAVMLYADYGNKGTLYFADSLSSFRQAVDLRWLFFRPDRPRQRELTGNVQEEILKSVRLYQRALQSRRKLDLYESLRHNTAFGMTAGRRSVSASGTAEVVFSDHDKNGIEQLMQAARLFHDHAREEANYLLLRFDHRSLSSPDMMFLFRWTINQARAFRWVERETEARANQKARKFAETIQLAIDGVARNDRVKVLDLTVGFEAAFRKVATATN